MSRSERRQRNILERWYIEGELTLLTPTLLSNGDVDPSVDLPILTDPLTGCALLTGSTLAGGLRSYLTEFFNSSKEAETIFGGSRKDNEGAQSLFIVEDSLGDGEKKPTIELRDGVKIDEKTRTAAEHAKYDLELLAAGTTFKISFELIVTEGVINKAGREKVTQHLAIILGGLQNKEIRLGMRKGRGFGECVVSNWKLVQYELKKPEHLLAWLNHDSKNANWEIGSNIYELLGISADQVASQDKRTDFMLVADFDITGSVLIRSGFESKAGADVSHLTSKRPGKKAPVPVLSGTSLGGVIRAQIGRIARTLDSSENNWKAQKLLNHMFGAMDEDDKESTRAGKVRVDETEIQNGRAQVQQRVAIDRFTGGALETALFAEQPIFGGETQIRVKVARPNEAEIGLMLLLLKDLWTSHTPVGGEASVGRGRLKGKKAILTHGSKCWILTETGNGNIDVSSKTTSGTTDNLVESRIILESYVSAIKPTIDQQMKPEVIAT